MFTEVWLGPHLGFDAANASAQIFGSGQNSISWISYVDVARFAAASVDNAAADNCVILRWARSTEPVAGCSDL
jgi:hypothetical protein